MKTKKIILPESQMPTQWYNIVSDMKNRPLPPLNPATKEPVTLEQMSDISCASFSCASTHLA